MPMSKSAFAAQSSRLLLPCLAFIEGSRYLAQQNHLSRSYRPVQRLSAKPTSLPYCPGFPADFAKVLIVKLYTSLPLLIEVDDALRRGKFQVRLQQAQVTADDLTLGYAALATTVEPVAVPPVIPADPDDDAAVALALAAQAEAVVSGDGHPLQLGAYSTIPILPAEILIDQLDLRSEQRSANAYPSTARR